jgi:hypothetical protein
MAIAYAADNDIIQLARAHPLSSGYHPCSSRRRRAARSAAATRRRSRSADQLRMCCLLADVNCRRTKTGVSFTWSGAWEYDPMSGTGTVKLDKDGRLKGKIKINDGDESTFIAERADEPKEPIPDPPRYRDKWRRR